MSVCKDLIFMPTVELITLEKISRILSVLNCGITEQILPYYLKNEQALLIIQPQKPRIINIEDYPIVEPFVLKTHVKPKHEMASIDISEKIREMKKKKLLQMMNEDKQQKTILDPTLHDDGSFNMLSGEVTKKEGDTSVEGVEARINKRIEKLRAEKAAKVSAGKKIAVSGGRK